MQNTLLLSNYREPAKTQTAYVFIKRSFDIICSLFLIVLLMPVLLAVAVISAIDTKSCPIFIQTRMGRNNRPFRMIKFRTMNTQAPSNLATHRFENALNYISPVGSALRKLSLDELPQLFNILLGDMSFVGPRPVVLTETDLLRMRDKNGALSVRPGLTGWAQVNGRDLVSVADKAVLDGYYIDNMSLSMDWTILKKTVGYVLRARDISEGAALGAVTGEYRLPARTPVPLRSAPVQDVRRGKTA